MYKKLAIIALTAPLLVGCASVPMERKEKSVEVKKFTLPSKEKSGLYIYRVGGGGAILKKDVWVNDKCIGETAPYMFFYELVVGGKEHKISTESEFSPNDLLVKTEGGKNYFIKQYIKSGLFVGGADLKLVHKDIGEKEVSRLGMAKKGNCSK